MKSRRGFFPMIRTIIGRIAKKEEYTLGRTKDKYTMGTSQDKYDIGRRG